MIRELSLLPEVEDEEREAPLDKWTLLEGQNRLEPNIPAEKLVRRRVQETNLINWVVLKQSSVEYLCIAFKEAILVL